jgi:hypothetical protein
MLCRDVRIKIPAADPTRVLRKAGGGHEAGMGGFSNVIYIQAPFELILNVNSAVLAFLRREGKSELATGVNRQTEGGVLLAPLGMWLGWEEILRDQSSFPIYLTDSVAIPPSS